MNFGYFPNKYSGKCAKCGGKVPSNEGICFKDPIAHGFLCACRNCYPLESAKVYADRDSAKAVEALDQMKLEARRLELIEERKALIAKLGLCLDSPFDPKLTQGAWNDLSEWKVPFNGDGTDEEFRKALQAYPPVAGQAALRHSGGVNLKEVNRGQGYVVLCESIQLCD